MPFVDLHVHTVYSDGHDTPAAAVKMAAENGVAVMGVTDHDNLGGIAEALAAGEKFGVKVVPGVEISVGFHDHSLHLLGYGFAPEDAEFDSFLKKIFAWRRAAVIRKMELASDVFVAQGKHAIDIDEFVRKQGVYFNREKSAEYLVVNGYLSDREAAFQMLAKTRIELARPASAEEAAAAVHKAGGLAILAHPFARGTSLRKIDPAPEGQESLLKELIAAGIDGFECYQSEYGPEETSLALSLCKKYSLLASVGSDWHGALCDVGWVIKDIKSYYPEHIGGLGITTGQIAPLLGRLGIDA
jgi:3',5'-nucleoside bisphosphate phosphatase